MDIYEFLRERGIPESDLKPVENIVDESLKRLITTDSIKGFEWLFYKSLGIGESYARSRRWDANACLRDILQNAFDASEEVELYADKEGVHVIDHGEGMPYRAFIFGGLKAENPCYRGGFGEGLKIALTTLTAIYGYDVYIITTNLEGKTTAYKVFAYYDPVFGENVIYLAVGKTDRAVKPHGTHVIIAGMSKRVLKEIKIVKPDNVLFTLKAPPVVTLNNADFVDKYPCKVKYQILNLPDELYASDLYFGRITELDRSAGKPVFGYNVWMTTLYELEPNREAYKLQGRDYTYTKIALTLARAPGDIWDEIVDKAFTVVHEGKARIVQNKDVFEVVNLPYSELSVRNKKMALGKLIGALKRKYGEDISYLKYGPDVIVDRIIHYAPPRSTVVLLVVDWDTKDIQALGLAKDFISYVSEVMDEEEAKVRKENLEGTLAYDYVRALLDTILEVTEVFEQDKVNLFVFKKPTREFKGFSDYEDGKVKIGIAFENKDGKPNPSETVRLLVHELAHAWPYLCFSFAIEHGVFNRLLDHNERVYEYALQDITERILNDKAHLVPLYARLGVAFRGQVPRLEDFKVHYLGATDDVKFDVTVEPEEMVRKSMKFVLMDFLDRYGTRQIPQLVLLRIHDPWSYDFSREVPSLTVFPIKLKIEKGIRGVETWHFGEPAVLELYERIRSGDSGAVRRLVERTVDETLEKLKKGEWALMRDTVYLLVFVNPVEPSYDVLGVMYIDRFKRIYADYKGRKEVMENE